MDTQLRDAEVAGANQGTAALLDHPETTDRPHEAMNTNEAPPALFGADEANNLRSQWEKIQIHFVDQPRESVQRADDLVAQAIKRLIEMFAHERENMEHDWDRGDQVYTEDLRIALQRYRAFFDRLLKI